MSGFDGRHPDVTHFEKLFEFEHLPRRLQAVSRPFRLFVAEVLDELPADGPELTAGLRKLLEAKDCFVRHAVLTLEPGPVTDQGEE